MSSLSEYEIRLRILHLLAKPPKKGSTVWGTHKSIIQEAMPISERAIDVSISYLARNGLVKLVQVGADWLWAKITPVGLDVLQNPTRYEERYPFLTSSK